MCVSFVHKRCAVLSLLRREAGADQRRVNAVLSSQVARKLVILEGELERAEERAEVSEV